MSDRWTFARMTSMTARAATLSALIFLAACDGNPVQPRGALTLSARMDDTQIDSDDRSTLTMTLTNGSSEEIALTFPSACQLLPQVDRAGTNERVYGDAACAAVITNLRLAAGESTSRTFVIRGAAAASPGLVLSGGTYDAYATLAHPDYPLRSTAVRFIVD